MKTTVLAVTLVLVLASLVFFSTPITDKDVEDDSPIADAGPDLTVQENELVTFNGSASKGSKGVVVFGNNTNVTEVSYGRDKPVMNLYPDVKVDGIGVIHVVWCGQMGGFHHTFYSSSTDQGLTFEKPLTLSGPSGFVPNPCRAVLDVGPDGYVHVIWTNWIDSLYPVMYYSMSTDRGDTFSTPVPIDYGNSSSAGDVLSDSQGVVHITFGEGRNFYHIRSEDNGSTFSDPTRINDVPGESYGGPARLGPNDSIHVVWMDERDWQNEKLDLYYSVSHDGGSSFRAGTLVHDKDGKRQVWPSLAVDESGNPYVVWIEEGATTDKLFYSVSYDGGTSFESKTVIVVAQKAVRKIRVPSVEMGDDGLPHVVWAESGRSYDYYNINYTKMDKIEKEFVRILTVNDDNGVFSKTQPSMDIDSNGTAHVVWVDSRNAEPWYRNDVYYARSTLGRARIVSYQWDMSYLYDSDGDGNFTNDVDATGPTPSFTYGDDGNYTVTLKVIDELGETAYDTAKVTVLNVNPSILSTSYEMNELNASFTFRVAGEKWHNVEVQLFEDEIEIGHANIMRHPGSPNDQMISLANISANLTKTYSAIAYYTPEDDPINGQIWGATPAWFILKFDNEEKRIHHTFNVRQEDTWIWNAENLNQHFPFVVSFEAVASDPGSDDLTFTWDWGDGTSSSKTYYNDGIGPDPYPSPDVNPITVIDCQKHVFATAGKYTLLLTVEDDDGGWNTTQIILSI